MRIQNFSTESFTGKREKKQTFENFREFFERDSSAQILRESISPENKLGEGWLSSVYSINENDTFVLKVNKVDEDPLKNMRLTRVADRFPDLNLGQPVARLAKDSFVIIKQSGIACGMNHYKNNKIVVPNEGHLEPFMSYLRTVSEFPQESYDGLAGEVKTIFSRFMLFDFLNSENVLYDIKTQAFNIVDVYNRWFTFMLNCKEMTSLSLLDFQHFPKLLSLAKPEQKDEMLENSAKIVDKSIKAYYKHDKFSQSFTLDSYLFAVTRKIRSPLREAFFDTKKFIKSISSSI